MTTVRPSTTKQSMILAVDRTARNRVLQAMTAAQRALLREELITGLNRTYRPLDDEGETRPPQSKPVQVDAETVIHDITDMVADLFDLVDKKERTNTIAKADIVIEGESEPLLTDVPVTYLLFLERQLVDLHTFIKKLPVLDPAETWTRSEAANAWVSEPTETASTKKVRQNHVKSPPTDKHPAQVETFDEDVKIGTWRTVKFSGALPAARVARLRTRVETLQAAVKFAREEANTTRVIAGDNVGRTLIDFVLG